MQGKNKIFFSENHFYLWHTFDMTSIVLHSWGKCFTPARIMRVMTFGNAFAEIIYVLYIFLFYQDLQMPPIICFQKLKQFGKIEGSGTSGQFQTWHNWWPVHISQKKRDFIPPYGEHHPSLFGCLLDPLAQLNGSPSWHGSSFPIA